MKKAICLSIFLSSSIIVCSAFAQSNDEKAISFLDKHLQTMFKVLNSKPETISPTCMDSLKKLHNLKEQLTKAPNTQRDINLAILRALYSNSIQFCETDVQAICSKRAEPSVRIICKEISSQNN
ncbi:MULTISPECIES: hypothetical protein [Commensalibacter]|uniref:Uncharacterized protein n=2 Tax=Commensalibacter TaxID=1079922 RepID=W7E6K0_9PROT|nr:MULTISPECIES: hypothetical protein [Commensalibacter]EUK18751.1 hypothetical protein COMX_03345 [Commensalibacter papalotli (ex Servin-Garciduenas et al. 2014)]CAI3923888.1 unnamed protein product [Commensalibacter papalotli (ex Botero et al. 2024)]CAI3928217.1 unnamed protein product [Commensalibacter papalotli (ex Botero et al. 2024)]